MNDLVLESRAGGVITLTLNRPDQYNALSEAMLEALQSALDRVKVDESARAVILTARGRAFCAGHDLREMRAHPDEAYQQALFERCGRVMQSLVGLPVPVIAQVQGVATAAGCQLVASCDLAIAATTARFAVSGINLGLFCSTPAVALSRNVSRKRAFEMLSTGDFISAETAAEWGLINRAVAPETLEAETRALAEKIAAKVPVAMRMGKALFYRQAQAGLAAAYDDAARTMACNMMDADAQAGIDRFLNKKM